MVSIFVVKYLHMFYCTTHFDFFLAAAEVVKTGNSFLLAAPAQDKRYVYF